MTKSEMANSKVQMALILAIRMDFAVELQIAIETKMRVLPIPIPTLRTTKKTAKCLFRFRAKAISTDTKETYTVTIRSVFVISRRWLRKKSPSNATCATSALL